MNTESLSYLKKKVENGEKLRKLIDELTICKEKLISKDVDIRIVIFNPDYRKLELPHEKSVHGILNTDGMRNAFQDTLAIRIDEIIKEAEKEFNEL